MAYCGKCGNQIPDGDLFCSKCGAKIGGSAAAPASALAVANQDNRYSVILTSVPDDKKGGVIQVLRMEARCGVAEAKNMINTVPCTVKSNLSKNAADALAAKLTEAGAYASSTA